MLKLAPSILAADFAELGAAIRAVESAGAHYLHIDIMDGIFVPNISLGIPIIKSIRPITQMLFDVHLMIMEPERYIKDFALAGADIINVHTEACGDLKRAAAKIKVQGKKAAVTVKPATDIECVYDALDKLDMVLIMSVEPGFGGQELMPEALDKAARLAGYIARKNLNVDIEMDGGITHENAEEVLRHGVNVIVAGSSIFRADDKAAAVTKYFDIFRKFESMGGRTE
ncbi:MAG: ribulose-phosphate 3-epimerase [Clostridiales bacterium]|jgi:ribulose-phosphate 3-epimerase|nr:ribulose-phosphate 3-epimerase [Clostridiales bacterium]